MLYFRHLRTIPELTAPQQVTLGKEHKEGCALARSKLLVGCQRYITAIARKRSKQDADVMMDLVQSANAKVCASVATYDPRHGVPFTGYVSRSLVGAMTEYRALMSLPFRVPTYMLRALVKVRREEAVLRRVLTTEEAVARTGLRKENYEASRHLLHTEVVSLDTGPIVTSDSVNYIGRQREFPDDDLVPADKCIERREQLQRVLELMRLLTPFEARIVKWRFWGAHEDGEEMTLREIGERYNLSRERIRTLQEQAIRKIRHALQQDDAEEANRLGFA